MSSTAPMFLRNLSRYLMSRKIMGSSVALIEARCLLVFEQLDIELQPAHAREVILARIEEHALEQCRCRIERRRIARAQLAINLNQRFRRSP